MPPNSQARIASPWVRGGGLVQLHPRQQKDSSSTRSVGLEYCRDQAKAGLYSQLRSSDAYVSNTD